MADEFDDDKRSGEDGSGDDSVPYEFNMDDLYPDGVPSDDGQGADDVSGHVDDADDAGGHGADVSDEQPSKEQQDDLAAFEQEFGGSTGDQFEDELAGLLGAKAKSAVLITQLVSADLLAAFCQLSDISADCLADEKGAIAVLHNLDGDAPEAAIKDLTTVVSGMPAILSVNRADKLESTLYVEGKPLKQKFPPPVLFNIVPTFAEDLLLGIADVRELKLGGEYVASTADLDRAKALKIIAEHTKFGPGHSSIE